MKRFAMGYAVGTMLSTTILMCIAHVDPAVSAMARNGVTVWFLGSVVAAACVVARQTPKHERQRGAANA